jgi:protein-tyrosine phosphatase
MPERSIRLDGAPNFRDLGGLPAADGATVAYGRVFRSENLAHLTNTDVARLTSVGVRTVVDFRHDFEVDAFGVDRLPPGANYLSLPITAGGMDASTHEALRSGDLNALPDLTVANRNFVRNNRRELGGLLRILAEPGNLPAIFHCIGGKDRTGIASAVLLSALGVPWSNVQADYLATNHQVEGRVEQHLAHLARTTGYQGTQSPASLEAARRFFVLEARYIDAARDEMIARAGSVEDYIRRDLEVTPATVARLRHELLEPATGADATAPPPNATHQTEPLP